MQTHRLTWRGYCAVHIQAANRAEAIAKALVSKPTHIPAGTQLFYGIVGGQPVGVAQ